MKPSNNKSTAQNTEQGRKQVLLRLSPSLWKELSAWADADFRSINGQIEYLLSESVRRRKKIPVDDLGRQPVDAK